MPRRTFALLLAGTIAIAGCGGSGTKTAGTTATTAKVGSTTATAEPSPLLPLLASEVPAGFELQPDDVGDTGPSDLAKATADDGADDAEKALTDAGFVRGYQQLWVNGDEDEIILIVYEFKTGPGATSYQKRGEAVLADPAQLPAGVHLTPLEVPGIAGVYGTTAVIDASETDPASATAVVLFTRGVYTVQVIANGGPSAPVAERALQFSKEQFDKLA
jgi:hypothetical protein